MRFSKLFASIVSVLAATVAILVVKKDPLPVKVPKGIASKAHPGPARMKGAMALLTFIVTIGALMGRVTQRNRETWRVDNIVVSASPFGDTWYVDTVNGADTNSGRQFDDAFATLDEARTQSGVGDTIVIAPGTYTQTAADQPLTPKADQTWIAGVGGRGGQPTVLITGTAEAVVVDIAVDNVIFEGIHFQADADAVSELVRIGEGAAVAGGGFIDCWFDGNGKTTVNGISADHATQAWTGGIVRGCRFVLCTVCIDVGVSGIPLALIELNTFDMQVGPGDIGINMADTTALATGYGYVIRNNDFIGAIDAGRDVVGIVLVDASGQDTIAIGMLGRNYFSNCTLEAITVNKLNENFVRNYVGDTTVGGVIVDPGA